MDMTLVAMALLLAPLHPPEHARPPRRVPHSHSLRGPTLGFVFDSAAHAVRPILGMPGAAFLGPVLDTGAEWKSGVVSPNQDLVLAIGGDNLAVSAIRIADGRATVHAVDGATPAPDRILFSPDGSAAGLVHTGGAFEIVQGLPDAASVAVSIDLSPLAGTLTASAIADGGQAALAALQNGDTASVFALTPDGVPQLVYTGAHVSSLAFLHGSRDALIADDAANSAFLIRDITGQAASLQIATAQDGLAAPVAIRASSDNGRALIANSQPGSILAVDLSTGGMSSFPCSCAPETLQALSGVDVFRLTDSTAAPIWVFDAGAGEPRVSFIPGAKVNQQ